MKTLHDIKMMLSDLQEQGDDLKRRWHSDKREEKKRLLNIKKLQTKAAELKTFILYLEKNPDSEFINKEVTRLTARKNAILGYMPIEYKNMGYNPILKKEQKQWEKEQGIEKINKQLKALKFILS